MTRQGQASVEESGEEQGATTSMRPAEDAYLAGAGKTRVARTLRDIEVANGQSFSFLSMAAPKPSLL